MKIKTKSVLLSALSVGVAMFLLSYSAYGWFSMNREVRATGMNVSVIVPKNLQISSTGEENSFKESVEINLKDIVKKNIDDNNDETKFDTNKNFFLLPASSYDGLTMWKCDSAKQDGSANCDENEYINVSGENGRIKYNPSTSSFEGYYIDVPLWLRTSYNNDLPVYLTKSTEILKVIPEDNEKKQAVSIVRMAFLNENGNAISCDNDYKALVYKDLSTTTTCNKVVDLDSNTNKSKYNDPNYITFKDNNSDQQITTVPKSTQENGVYSEKSVKIIVRIWIEGQDSNCVASALSGEKQFSIQIGFGIKD